MRGLMAAILLGLPAVAWCAPPGSPLDRLVVGAYGLSRAEDVPAFRAAGCEIAPIELPLEFDAGKGDAERLEALLAACDEAGVWVILGLGGSDAGEAAQPSDNAWRTRVGSQIHALVEAVGEHTCVVGWMTPRRLSERLAPSPGDLQDWTARRYSSIDELNAGWGSRYGSFAEVRRADALDIGRLSPLGLTLSLVDLALADAALYRETVALFADTYRVYDAGQRPVLAGGESAYWAFASLPPNVQGALTDGRLGEAGPDAALCNPIAVDVARAGGRFEVLHAIPVRAASTPDDLRRAASAACLRGARGVLWSDWRTVSAEARLVAVSEEVASWSERLQGWRPEATCALLYEPIHTGPPSSAGRPLGGLLDSSAWPSEPMAILEQIARGTAWGGVDILPAHLVRPGDLDRYATILAPQLYDVPQSLEVALWSAVRGGSLLYADLGLGLRQSHGMTALPPGLIGLAGLALIPNVFPMSLSGTVMETNPALPSLPGGAVTEGEVFGPVIGDARLTGGARPWIVFRSRRDASRGFVLLYAGISVHRLEQGAVVFATAPALATWSPREPLGARLWEELLSRGAQIRDPGRGPVGETALLEARRGGGDLAAADYGAPESWATLESAGTEADCAVGAVIETSETSGVRWRIPLAGGGVAVARGAPVRVLSPSTGVWLDSYGAQGLVARIAPAGVRWRATTDGPPEPEPGPPIAVGLAVASGAMPILAREEFDVIQRPLDGSPEQNLRLLADEAGVLTLTLDLAAPVEIEIRPRHREEDDG